MGVCLSHYFELFTCIFIHQMYILLSRCQVAYIQLAMQNLHVCSHGVCTAASTVTEHWRSRVKGSRVKA